MTYQEALTYLEGLDRFGIRLGLERMRSLVARLGQPQRRYLTLHVTGTNGKGSTTAYLAAVLQAAGLRTGMYTSPHLERYTERVRIDGEEVGEDVFAAAVAAVAAAAAEMEAAGEEHPTQFEVLTAAAFVAFAAQKVDCAVIEVGLGGELDSTNVIDSEVAVITNVALEHTDRCGSTLAAIAAHKAGIIRAGKPVVTAARGDALEIIRQRAQACGSPLWVLGEDWQVAIAELTPRGLGWQLQGPDGKVMTLRSSLLGEHQAVNGSLAVMAARALGQPRLEAEVLQQGIGAARWPGRFEVLRQQPPLVLDGAHNPAGAAALRCTLEQVYPGRAVIFLLGILRDKDIDGIVQALVHPGDSVVAVRPSSARAAEAAEVASRVQAHQVEAVDDWESGVRRLLQLAAAQPQAVACVAGSLYLLGSVRPLLQAQLAME